MTPDSSSTRRPLLRRPSRSRNIIAAIAAAIVGLLGVVVGVSSATSADSGPCSVVYDVVLDWTDNEGQMPHDSLATVEITNTGDAIDEWDVQFDMPSGQVVTTVLNGRFTQTGATVNLFNETWNGSLAAGETVKTALTLGHAGDNVSPESFTVNGGACDAETPDPDPSTPDPDPSTPDPSTPDPDPSTPDPSTPDPDPDTTTTTTDSSTSTSAPDTTPPPESGDRVDNPFVGAAGYINPDWQAMVNETADAVGGELGDDMRTVGQFPTAVWLDRIAAISPGDDRLGLRQHLDNAVEQAAGEPMTIMVVIYDLPNRDCAALASNGELRISEGGLERYKTEYVDEIISIMADPAYANLRIVNIVEPDSLPNLVTNLETPDCAEAASTGAYVDGIAYTLGQLRTLPNTYAYVDLGHSGWLGWDSNFGPAVDLITEAIKHPDAGVDTVDGFVSNTAGYTPTDEEFLPDNNLVLGDGGMAIHSSSFYEWNPYFDETDFMTDIRQQFISAGLPDDIGMLIDTSRNGWGGSERPSAVSTSTDLDTYVDESRIDRRPHRGGWCNQDGAGLGERPTAAPQEGIDAYVWVKPPGESDGVSEAGIVDPDDPAKGFDGMCDPTASNTSNSAFGTNALPGAPHAGSWFAEQFEMLVTNAHPAL